MKSLIIELPGLFDQHLNGVFQESLKQLDLPLLSKAFSKADKYPAKDFNGTEYSRLEKSGEINPGFAAEFLSLTSNDVKSYKFWFRADPVELLKDITTIHLKGNRHLMLSEHQMKQLESSVNQLIQHLDAKFFLLSPSEGYIGCNNNAEVSFVSLLNALGNDQREMNPQGDDAKHWRQLQTEIQMCLFGTGGPEINLKNKASVNSLQFWGNPKAKIRKKQVDAIVSDSNLILGDARASKISTHMISDFNFTHFSEVRILQLVPMKLIWARKHGNVADWKSILNSIELNWMVDIFSALKQQKLEQIILLTGGEYYYRLKYSYLRKFWRREKSLANFIEG